MLPRLTRSRSAPAALRASKKLVAGGEYRGELAPTQGCDRATCGDAIILEGGAAMQANRAWPTFVGAIVAAAAMSGGWADAQPANAQPNPYRTVEGWAKMPEGRAWGATSAVDVAPDGQSIWVGERCGANTCAGSTLPSILQFDEAGRLTTSFGAGMFVFPHGMYVDGDGNVWLTDARGRDGKGHQVFKFSRDGKLLLTLGKAGVTGDGPDVFNQPSDVVVSASGDIFVADGHDEDSNSRIVKFSKDGKFIKTWGKRGSAPGEIDVPHALAFDSRGRLFVADRNNNRIQIFDQDGKFLDQWKQFSRPSGIYIDKNDVIYVADSESNNKTNPGWKRGIRIGSARDGKVTAFIPDPEPDPEKVVTSGSEGVAADARGNIYGAEVGPRALKKYVKK
jgi:sugar lactone lactonase YvrE